jgi:hypothetical protein
MHIGCGHKRFLRLVGVEMLTALQSGFNAPSAWMAVVSLLLSHIFNDWAGLVEGL